MFHPSHALNKWKHSIHQPLPLSNRKADQILNLLTTSFRRQLDAEHPTADGASAKVEKHSRPRKHSFPEQKTHYTDRHMHTILTNPLLRPLNDAGNKRTSKDPMDIFDRAVAIGMMDTNRAKSCLQAKKQEFISSSDLYGDMAKSGAGMKVLKWLISSGISKDNYFLKDEQFGELLTEFMVAEGLQEHAWRWITISFERIPTLLGIQGSENRVMKQHRREIADPLLYLVKAEAGNKFVSLDAAYMCISRAASILDAYTPYIQSSALNPAVSYAVRQTIRANRASRPAPTAAAFEYVVELCSVKVPQPDRVVSHMSLCHPSKPDAKLGLEFLRRFDALKDSQKEATSEADNHRVIRLGLDTAKVLLQSEKTSELQWVMDFLARNFPRQLAIQDRVEYENVKSEAASINYLSHLALA